MLIKVNGRCGMRATSSWAVLSVLIASSATGALAQSVQPPPAEPQANPQTTSRHQETQVQGAAVNPNAPEPTPQVEPSPGEIAEAQATIRAGGETAADAPPAEDLDQDSANEVSEVIVVGTRASLQSAIDRKRRAATNVDSIVAEDVSQFPDKNIGEALSRVTGVQLTRDFGEGSQVSIRGVEPDLNRVEINGLSLLGNSGTGNRGASFQELASELVASIDVFKGFTADMTEGGVGGTVSIRTRKPLDLREPLFSVTGSGQYYGITETTKFRGNITAGRKFFDNRFGIILNATFDDNDRSSDYLRNTEWVRFNTTATASGDYDNSPEKTFANPTFASAMRKQDCPTGTGAAALSCLQQWDDNIPRIPRYSQWDRSDRRSSFTGTAQYRFNDNLNAFLEYTRNSRDEFLTDFNRVVDVTAQSRIDAITYDRNGNPIRTAGVGLPVTRTAVVDANHNVINFFTASRASTGSTATLNTSGASANLGSANIFNVQTREFRQEFSSDYASGGFQWKSDQLVVDGLFGLTKAHQENDTNSVSFNASIPNIHIVLSDTGVPSFAFPSGHDPDNPATYGIFANNGAGVNYTTTAATFQYRPVLNDTAENTVKLDVDYLPDMPFFSKFEAGYQYRDTSLEQYLGGGYTMRSIDPVTGRPVNPIIVQGGNVNHNFNIGPTITSTSGPTTNFLTNPVTLTTNLSPARLLELVNSAGQRTRSNFFQGSQYDPGVPLPAGWFTPDALKALNSGLTDLSLFDQDLIFRSVGRNAAGAVVGEFDQIPGFIIEEKIQAGYLQTHFGTELFNRELSGNVGVRYVATETESTGSYIQRQTIDNPAGGNPITEEISTSVVSVNRAYEDYLPSFNLQYEFTEQLIARLSAAKVLARPRPFDLRPNANCVFNRTAVGLSDDDLDDCTAGNPALEPYRANQYDVTLSYFANRDTLLNASYFYKDIQSFILQSTLRSGVDLFGDGNLFDVRQPINGAGAKIKGLELSAQTVFTFLPAPFDGFGGQINYTYSKAENVGIFNQLTFEELPFPGLSEHSFNIVAFYDKGPLNARVAYQARTEYLQAAAERSGNPVFRDGTGYLDGRVAYRFNEHFTVFAEAKNLTDEIERTTSGDIRLTEAAWSGRRYFIGFTYRN